jgi:uncharacterized protein
MFDRFKRYLPTRHHVHSNRWLKWLGPHLMHPRLWHFSRRGVAIGVAVGVFFGFLIPIAQIPFAAATSVVLRANVPVAIGSTLVTNPVTFAPVYLFAHHLGASILGEASAEKSGAKSSEKPEVSSPALKADASPEVMGWWRQLWASVQAMGKPLMLGLAIIAVSAGIGSYFLIMLFWRIKTTLNWQRRKRKSFEKLDGL